jgi:ergothioneine biosynthesis protein EgtB
MRKFNYKVRTGIGLDKEKGEITYRISPLKEKTPFPIPFQRGEPSFYKEYLKMRERIVNICDTLASEDFMLVSPITHRSIKWYLGHSTWFFEMHVLNRFIKNYKEFSPRFDLIFSENRKSTPSLEFSRPTIEEIFSYRNYVDEAMMELFQYDLHEEREDIEYLIRMGLNLEGEGEEEILSILKYAMYKNFEFTPMKKTLREKNRVFTSSHLTEHWVKIEGGLINIGFGQKGFAFQEEQPRHTVFLSPFMMARDLVTNGQYLEFMLDGGYEREDFWLSEKGEKKKAPIYWRGQGDSWEQLTLYGWKKIDLLEPVSHLNFYEAYAYAEWADARLPTEFEWEAAAESEGTEKGNFLEGGRFAPQSLKNGLLQEEKGLRQLYGDVWQWTMSPFISYPGKMKGDDYGIYRSVFRPGELVLRGGSCFTRGETFRKTKRLHLPLTSYYFCSGIRLVRDI